MDLAHRVDAAWGWRVGLARRVDARVDIGSGFERLFHAWRVDLVRRVDAAWKSHGSDCLTLLLHLQGKDVALFYCKENGEIP